MVNYFIDENRRNYSETKMENNENVTTLDNLPNALLQNKFKCETADYPDRGAFINHVDLNLIHLPKVNFWVFVDFLLYF